MVLKAGTDIARRSRYSVPMTVIAGADVWQGRWVVVVLAEGSFQRAFVQATVAGVIRALAGFELLALDIPIGLPEEREHRLCDIEAKHFVGPRSSSVFHAPPRSVLEAPTYRDANRLSKRDFDRGVSAQAYALRTKILEVDPIASRDNRIVEVHPEASFRAMKGSTLAYPKKTWNGQMERRSLLQSHGIEVPDCLPDAGKVPADDLLDAAAAAWSAQRILRGEAGVLPAAAEAGSTGRRGVIWY
jgi:predicted RNase H-like nuclease